MALCNTYSSPLAASLGPHDGFPTELGICVPREYLLTIGVRR